MESSLELSKKAKRKSQEGLSKEYYENNEEVGVQKNGALPVGMIASIEEAKEVDGKEDRKYPESEGSMEKEKEHFKDKNSIPISHSSSRKSLRLYPVAL